jgi:hypothetical protein
MAKTKNHTQSVALRLSVNLSLDDVGLTRLYKELRDIETGASGLAPIQVHALKRRHLLKILHAYCADGIEPTSRHTDTSSTDLNQKSARPEQPIVTKAPQPTSLSIIEAIRQEHPPPAASSYIEADKSLLDSGFYFRKKT